MKKKLLFGSSPSPSLRTRSWLYSVPVTTRTRITTQPKHTRKECTSGPKFYKTTYLRKEKIKLWFELDMALQSLQFYTEVVQRIHICPKKCFVWGDRNRKISKQRPLHKSYVGTQNSFLIRASLFHTFQFQMWRCEAGKDRGFRRLKFKNECNQRSFIFCKQSNFNVKKQRQISN